MKKTIIGIIVFLLITITVVISYNHRSLNKIQKVVDAVQINKMITWQGRAMIFADKCYYLTFGCMLPKSTMYEIIESINLISGVFRQDRDLMLALVASESQFNPQANGKDGDYGLGQVILPTARETVSWEGSNKELKNKLLNDIQFNLLCTIAHYANVRKTCKDDWEAIRRYNGSGPKTFKHEARVKKFLKQFKETK